jgi:hypothetical protein
VSTERGEDHTDPIDQHLAMLQRQVDHLEKDDHRQLLGEVAHELALTVRPEALDQFNR